MVYVVRQAVFGLDEYARNWMHAQRGAGVCPGARRTTYAFSRLVVPRQTPTEIPFPSLSFPLVLIHFCICRLHAATVIEAVKFATTYTHHGIATAFPMGSGHGPLNHMHPLLPRVLHRQVQQDVALWRIFDLSHVGRPTRNDPYPLVRMLICSNADVWKQYVQHEFVKQLGIGTLSRERFIHFLK